jgi:hypothetical protein
MLKAVFSPLELPCESSVAYPGVPICYSENAECKTKQFKDNDHGNRKGYMTKNLKAATWNFRSLNWAKKRVLRNGRFNIAIMSKTEKKTKDQKNWINML